MSKTGRISEAVHGCGTEIIGKIKTNGTMALNIKKTMITVHLNKTCDMF
jgi:hypothetical protein